MDKLNQLFTTFKSKFPVTGPRPQDKVAPEEAEETLKLFQEIYANEKR